MELTPTQRTTPQLEEKLLGMLKVDRVLLITYRLDRARAWYKTASPDAFAGYAGAVNPNYITSIRPTRPLHFALQCPFCPKRVRV